MKITFIGTSHGVPSAERRCSCAMIEVGECVYFIDMGTQVTGELMKRNISMERIRAVFTTHVHGDHTGGLVDLISLCNWYFKNASFKTFITEPPLVDAIKMMLRASDKRFELDEKRLPLVIYDENTVYTDENIRVTFYPTKHLESVGEPSYAILLEAEGKKVMFSGDMSYGMSGNDFPVYALENKLDAFVCELAHFGIPQIKRYLDRLSTDALYFNHVSDLKEPRFDHISSLGGRYPFPVMALNDGDEIVL